MDCSSLHHICGSLLAEDAVVHFQRRRSLLMVKTNLSFPPTCYGGVLAQVCSMRLGSSVAVTISCLPEDMIE